jgi:hypothetical protein
MPELCGNVARRSGSTLTAIGSGRDIATAVTIRSDGKIVAVGQTFAGAQNAFVVARYDSNDLAGH